MRFAFRDEQLRCLTKYIERRTRTKEAGFCVLLGPRGVGKTTLLRETLAFVNLPVVYCRCEELVSEKQLSENIVEQTAKALGDHYSYEISTLRDTVEFAFYKAQAQPLVLVLDECQWLDKTVPSIWSSLQYLWDIKRQDSQIIVILCGTFDAQQIQNVFGMRHGPLYARADVMLNLRPFAAADVRELFFAEAPGGSQADLLLFYALTGGRPDLCEFLCEHTRLTSGGMLKTVFSPQGRWFLTEAKRMLTDDLKFTAPINLEILQAIALGTEKRSDIQKGINQDISNYISRLEWLYGLIKREIPLREIGNTRLSRFRIADSYLRFWLRYASSVQSTAWIELREWPRLIEAVKADLPVFLKPVLQQWLKQQLYMSGHWDEVGSWWDKKGKNELDLIAVDDSSKRLLIADVVLDARRFSAKSLNERSAAFLSAHPELQEYRPEKRLLTPANMLEPF